jgi:hypothetical protein
MEKSTGTLHVLELSIDSDVNWVEHECSNRRLNLEGVFLVRAFHGTHTAKEVFGEVLEAASFHEGLHRSYSRSPLVKHSNPTAHTGRSIVVILSTAE